ncbi:hypothetical protein Hanom_Chr09g00865291 [Helianthus anomalus]
MVNQTSTMKLQMIPFLDLTVCLCCVSWVLMCYGSCRRERRDIYSGKCTPGNAICTASKTKVI